MSGGAAREKPGRLPLSMPCAASVNWLTARTEPPTAESGRFILPASSRKMRRAEILRASLSAPFSVSPAMAQTRTRKPRPMAPVTWASTVTEASETRWTTARKGPSVSLRRT